MAECYVCKKEVTPNEDCESRFLGGAKTRYICYGCIKKGHDEVLDRRMQYFDTTYEGRKRTENRRRKNRGL